MPKRYQNGRSSLLKAGYLYRGYGVDVEAIVDPSGVGLGGLLYVKLPTIWLAFTFLIVSVQLSIGKINVPTE
jgi:hypothetical protein